MINFNLLPPEIKEELKWEKINRSFIIYGIIIVAIIIVFILLLLIVQLYATIKLTELETIINLREENIKVKKVEELEEKIENFNKNLITLDKIQKNHLYFSQVISIFAESVPESVQITQLNIIQPKKEEKNIVQSKSQSVATNSKTTSIQKAVQKKYQVNINGKAMKRENLLIFKNALEKTFCFAKIYSPLSNLVKRENIDFHFTGDLNQKFLLKNN